MEKQTRSATENDLGAPVPKFCLTLEEYRRTPDGRVRPATEFLHHFFPHDPNGSTDRLFKYLPNDVRGPVLTSWGLRGAKSALKDTDEKVQAVVHDGLLAGDIDQDAFEQSLSPDTLVRWVPLHDYWAFWRAGKLTKLALHKALEASYDLGLFDAKWFFETVEGPGGKLKGTDVVSEGLSKGDLTEWMRKVHASGDGSPRGLLTALGWERIIGKTSNDVLIKVVDQLAKKIGLSPAPAAANVTPPAPAVTAAATPPSAPAVVAAALSSSDLAPESQVTIDDDDARNSTRMTPVPSLGSSPSIALGSIGRPLVTEASSFPRVVQHTTPPPLPALSFPPEKVESLFGDSLIPPSAPSEESISVDVEEESPTNRPPATAETEVGRINARSGSSPGLPSIPGGTSMPFARRR